MISRPFGSKFKITVFVGTVALSCLFPLCALANGLSTPFADVQLDKVPVGVATVVPGVAGTGLVLNNLGDTPIRVVVQVLQSAPGDLRGGAEPIPDVKWIKIEPNQSVLPAHGEVHCQMTLTVPKERKFRQKYYQATIWSRGESLKSQGMGINAGLISRFRFKTK